MSTLLNISNLSSRKLLTTAALAALFAVAGTSISHAQRHNAQITADGFSPSVIKVHPENGSWARIEERVLGLPVLIEIQSPPNTAISSYTVRQKGLPDGIPLEDNNFGGDSPAHFSAHRNYVGKTEWMTASERQAIIAECNEKLANGGDIHNTYNTFGSVGVRLEATFIQAPGLADNGNATVPIECVGASPRPAQAGAVVAQTPDFKVKGINLRFMTSLGYGQQVDADTKCKLTQVRVRVPTTKAGAVKFKLWTKIGNEPMTYDVVDAWSSFAGPGKFEAVYTKALPVTKTTKIRAKAEEMNNTFGLSTEWKEVTVPCKTERGGFASTPTAPTALPVVMGRPGIIVSRPPLAPRPGVIVDRPRPGYDGFPQRGGLVKLKAETSGRPVFATGRFQRGTARPF